MDFFAKPIVANPNATSETLVKQRLSWNAGLKGCFSNETRAKISESLKNSSKLQQVMADPEYRKRQREITKNSEAVRIARLESRSKAEATKQANGYYIPKKIQTPNGVFNGIKEIMAASGRSKRTVFLWMKLYPEHYYYLEV